MGNVTVIRRISLNDAEPLAEVLARNREFLAPWDPARPPGFFTVAGQRAVIEQALRGVAQGVLEPQVILAGDQIIGRVTLSDIVRGSFESCNLGYWVSASVGGRGHATAAVAHISRLAFDDLRLHRIQAGILPHNIASQRVLQHNGFEPIGTARAYLKIADRWQDHVLYQLINPDTAGVGRG